MTTHVLEVRDGSIAYDDTGGDDPLVVLLPGAGDVRSEYRFLAPRLAAGRARVVTADLRGHGGSSAAWPSYGMRESAADLVALLEHLDAGPATVVATSFAPTAAIWAATDRPELVDRLVLISAHLDAPPAFQAALLRLAMRGPLTGRLWAGQYRGWHPDAPPADLDEHAASLAAMLSDPDRRRAARETLTAHRDGLDERLARLDVPTLVVMGGGDSHFPDATAEAASIAARTGGTAHVVEGAGHYPHVEHPDRVASAITSFLAGTAT